MTARQALGWLYLGLSVPACAVLWLVALVRPAAT